MTQFGADPLEYQIFSDFTGGMNCSDPAESLDEKTMTDICNAVLTESGRLVQRNPFHALYNAANIEESAETYFEPAAYFAAQFSESAASSYLIGRVSHALAHNKSLYFLKNATPPWEELKYNDQSFFKDCNYFALLAYKSGQAEEWLAFSDNIRPRRIQIGSSSVSASDMGFGASGATCSIQTTTPGVISLSQNDKVHYKLVTEFISSSTTKNGLSKPSSAFTFTASTALTNGALNLTISKDASVDAAFIHIYRAPKNSQDGVYRWIGTVANPATTVVFRDNTAFGSEGDPLPVQEDLSLATLKVGYAANIHGTIFAFNALAKSKLMWSAPGQPDVWPALNFANLRGDGKAVVGFNRKIYILTSAAVYEMDNPDAPVRHISNVGCAVGQTAHEAGIGIIWADNSTFYFADFVNQYGSKGDFPKDIGAAVRVKWSARDITKPVSSAFYNMRYYVSFYEKARPLPQVYVYDLRYGAWTRFDAPAQMFQLTGADLFCLLVSQRRVESGSNFETKTCYAVGQEINAFDNPTLNKWADTVWQETNPVFLPYAISIERSGLRYGDLFVPVFPLACLLTANAISGEAEIALTVQPQGRQITETFSLLEQTAVDPADGAYYDDAEYADSSDNNSGKGVYFETLVSYYKHKRKINRPIRALELDIRCQIKNAQFAFINAFGFTYRQGNLT